MARVACAAPYPDTRCPPLTELCKIRKEIQHYNGTPIFHSVLCFTAGVNGKKDESACTLSLCTNRDDLGPIMMILINFTAVSWRKKKKIPTSKQNQVKHQSVSCREGKMFLFGVLAALQEVGSNSECDRKHLER